MSSKDRRASVGISDATTAYLVECDGCEFETAVDGRDEAARTAQDHLDATGHEVVAVEMPPHVQQ